MNAGCKAFFGLLGMAGILTLCIVGWNIHVARGMGFNAYRVTDLAEINHPDIFRKHRWSSTQGKDRNALLPVPTVTPRPTLDINRPPLRGKPIPFQQLDTSLVQRVHFDFDKSTLKPDAKTGIQKNVNWILKHPEYDILLEGHCDEQGTNEYNLALGERRGNSVEAYMIELGVPRERIVSRSYGEEKPLDVRRNQDAYRMNRRVEFYAIPLD